MAVHTTVPDPRCGREQAGLDGETLFRRSPCSYISIKPYGLGGVAQIAQLVAVYLWQRNAQAITTSSRRRLRLSQRHNGLS